MRSLSFLLLVLTCLHQNAQGSPARTKDPQEAPKVLLTLHPEEDSSKIVDCQGPQVALCQKAEVDYQAFFEEDSLLFPGGVILHRKAEVEDPDEPDTVTYFYTNSDDGEALLMYSNATGYDLLEGEIFTDAKKPAFLLQDCGPDCQVFITSKPYAKKEQGPDSDEASPSSPPPPGLGRPHMWQKEANESDASTAASSRSGEEIVINLRLYATRDYFWSFSNPTARIKEQILEATNEFQNSEIPVRFHVDCGSVQYLPIEETDDFHERLDLLEDFREKASGILRGADVAVVFYKTCTSKNSGGTRAINPWANYWNIPLIWVANDCGQRVLTHELGHIFNARHNLAHDDTEGSNHGKLMDGGYRTIMAYNSYDYHPVVVPKFSSPTQTYKSYPVGSEMANNQQAIYDQVRAMAPYSFPSNHNCIGDVCHDLYNRGCQWVGEGRCDLLVSSEGFKKRPAKYYCPWTCGMCDKSACGDGSIFCAYWASKGFCSASSRYHNFMASNCKKICNKC